VLAKRYPHLEITLYDQESVVQIAAANAETAGVADRVHACARDIFAGEYAGEIDGFLAMNIFGIWSLERNAELFSKCHRALPDGGPLLVFDFVCDDDNTGPLTAGMISPYFLALSSEEGMVYAPSDMEQALRDAGFSRIERYDGLGFNHALVIGYK
jgi:cyclopropane fatty-acyl-phospholipid synthase-like methyltransferase